MSNVYYDPADFGLVLVETLDEAGLSYEYNTLIVLQHTASKRLFWASDSGCSCPTPFENYHFSSSESGINTDLTEINLSSYDRFADAVNEFPVSVQERSDCLLKVRQLLLAR